MRQIISLLPVMLVVIKFSLAEEMVFPDVKLADAQDAIAVICVLFGSPVRERGVKTKSIRRRQ